MQNHEFKLVPSRQYIIIMGIFSISSLIIFLYSSFPMMLKLPFFLFLLAYIVRVIVAQVLLKSNSSIIAIRVKGEGEYYLSTRKKVIEANIMSYSAITSFVSLLRFQVGSRELLPRCIVFRDSLKEGEYRKLLVILQMR